MRKNHIEYDEEKYHQLIQNLIKIYSENGALLGGFVGSIERKIKDLNRYDFYDSSEINNSSKEINNCVNMVGRLKQNINYSLLVYQACDSELLSAADKLIDNLFDENEKDAGKLFKDYLKGKIEDKDGIFEYKDEVDFNRLYDSIPVYTVSDDNGNIWYYNRNNCLIGAHGENLTFQYGGEEFNVSFTDNGILQLTDLHGNPINIFGNYNIESHQYGGDQDVFVKEYERLLADEKIVKLLDYYFPDFPNIEDRVALLNSVGMVGCGMTAFTNAVFKEFEGSEEQFYNTFGYSMYDIKRDDSGNMLVDYNYEPLILELSLYKNFPSRASGDNANRSENINWQKAVIGTRNQDYNTYVNLLRNNYGLSVNADVRLVPYLWNSSLKGSLANKDLTSNNHESTIINLMNGIGNWRVEIGDEESYYHGSHAMYAISAENEQIEVSTWGCPADFSFRIGSAGYLVTIKFGR